MYNSSIKKFNMKINGLFVFFVLFSMLVVFKTISAANDYLTNLSIFNHDFDSFRRFNHLALMIFDGVDFTVPNIVDEIDSNGIKYGGINF